MKAKAALLSHGVNVGLSLSADLNSGCFMIQSKAEGCLRERINRAGAETKSTGV